MKRKLVTIGYLLWAIAFFPTAAIVAVLSGLPYFLAVYRFHWVNWLSGILGLDFYMILMGVFSLFFLYEDGVISSNKETLNYYYKMIGSSGVVSSLFFGVWCLGAMLRASFIGYALWLGIPVALTGLIFAIFFVRAARDAFRLDLVSYCAYPKDRSILIRAATDRRYDCRAALEKLPYPQERETLVQAALHDAGSSARRAALDKLPYPQERETIVQIALHDADSGNRRVALAKLPYPQERETLVQIVLHDEDYRNRHAAFDKLPLPYPQERETIVQIGLYAADSDIRYEALEKLPYPQERENLVQIVLHDEDQRNRNAAFDKLPLPYPQERETIVQIALHAADSDIRRAALEKLPYPQERETITQVAMSDSTLSNRKIALEYLSPYLDKDAYLSVINFCEKAIQSVHNDVNPAITKSADTLAALYHKMNVKKTVSHRHVVSTPYDDHDDHEDEGDHLIGSGNHIDYTDHSDRPEAYDDYYVIICQ